MQSSSSPGYSSPTEPSGKYPLPAYPPPPTYPPPAGYAPPPGYAPPYTGFAPPTKRRVPWWGHLLALVIPPPIALAVGAPIAALLLWGTYGDSTPPPGADHAAAWLAAAYICVSLLFGLGVHAIVIRRPWIFLAGVAVTAAVIVGMVVAYANLGTAVP